MNHLVGRQIPPRRKGEVKWARLLSRIEYCLQHAGRQDTKTLCQQLAELQKMCIPYVEKIWECAWFVGLGEIKTPTPEYFESLDNGTGFGFFLSCSVNPLRGYGFMREPSVLVSLRVSSYVYMYPYAFSELLAREQTDSSARCNTDEKLREAMWDKGSGIFDLMYRVACHAFMQVKNQEREPKYLRWCFGCLVYVPTYKSTEMAHEVLLYMGARYIGGITRDSPIIDKWWCKRMRYILEAVTPQSIHTDVKRFFDRFDDANRKITAFTRGEVRLSPNVYMIGKYFPFQRYKNLMCITVDDSTVGLLFIARQHYESENRRVKEVIIVWTMAAARMRRFIAPDVRKIISRIIWEDRKK